MAQRWSYYEALLGGGGGGGPCPLFEFYKGLVGPFGGGGGGCPCPLSEFHKGLCRHFARFLCRLSEFRLRGIVSGNSTLFN